MSGQSNVAKDLDAIRAALGDTSDHLGYSYGTRIGSAYAEFPQQVRAMILDGAVD